MNDEQEERQLEELINHLNSNKMTMDAHKSYKYIKQYCIGEINLKYYKNHLDIQVMPLTDLITMEDDCKSYSSCFKCSLGFIDLSDEPDNGYNFVLVYQDDVTKFTILKPIKEKCKDDVLCCLLEIFALIGVPAKIYTLEKCLVKSAIKNEIGNLCHDFATKVKIPKSSEFQDTECHRIHKSIKDWMQYENSPNWSRSLNIVQFHNNCDDKNVIRTAPFSALLRPNYTYTRKNYTRYLADSQKQNIACEFLCECFNKKFEVGLNYRKAPRNGCELDIICQEFSKEESNLQLVCPQTLDQSLIEICHEQKKECNPSAEIKSIEEQECQISRQISSMDALCQKSNEIHSEKEVVADKIEIPCREEEMLEIKHKQKQLIQKEIEFTKKLKVVDDKHIKIFCEREEVCDEFMEIICKPELVDQKIINNAGKEALDCQNASRYDCEVELTCHEVPTNEYEVEFICQKLPSNECKQEKACQTSGNDNKKKKLSEELLKQEFEKKRIDQKSELTEKNLEEEKLYLRSFNCVNRKKRIDRKEQEIENIENILRSKIVM